MLSWAEFQEVRERIHAPGTAKPQHHAFPYTGFIRCGVCGFMITAERKTKASGKTYIYYHCVKRALGPRCPEPSISAAALEQQFEDFLATIALPPGIAEVVLRIVEQETERERELAAAKKASFQEAAARLESEARELTQLRLRSLLTDEEFVRERNRITEERLQMDQARSAQLSDTGVEATDALKDTLSFSSAALQYFREGDDTSRSEVVKIAGSNPTLKGKILSIQAAEPFRLTLETGSILEMCG